MCGAIPPLPNTPSWHGAQHNPYFFYALCIAFVICTRMSVYSMKKFHLCCLYISAVYVSLLYMAAGAATSLLSISCDANFASSFMAVLIAPPHTQLSHVIFRSICFLSNILIYSLGVCGVHLLYGVNLH